MTKKIRAIGAAVLAAIWVVLTGFAWFSPAKETSEAERRPLAQFPELSGQTISEGKFMTEFEDYTLDQFPGRDLFRQLKALTHYYVLQQKDNNNYHIENGYVAEMSTDFYEDSVNKALERMNFLYTTYLESAGSKVYCAVIPDKGYYMAQQSDVPATDYEKLFAMVREETPWAQYIPLEDVLSLTDFYRTDTHWKQENLLPVAQRLTQAMGMTQPAAEEFQAAPVDYPFYGVYYQQAALPMTPDRLNRMVSQRLSGCKVYTYDDMAQKVEIPMYDMEKLNSGDPYNMYLSGARVGLVRIENPNAKTDRNLIVFRDSFGSAIGPLLVQEYSTVTLIDIREIPAGNLKMLARYVELDFTDADVLMLYSTLTLNAKTQEMK